MTMTIRKSLQCIRIHSLVGFLLLFVLANCSKDEKSNKDYNSKSINYITERLGKPTTEIEFILTKSVYEYQYGLLKHYPEPEGKKILIKEYCWEKKNKKTVVWFHKTNNDWVSLENLTWKDKIRY